jgi:hypothetical protein
MSIKQQNITSDLHFCVRVYIVIIGLSILIVDRTVTAFGDFEVPHCDYLHVVVL